MDDSLCARTEATLRGYQQRSLGEGEATSVWAVRPSPLGGRGLFATAPLQPGDVIFQAKPLVWGPKAAAVEPMCASCHRPRRVSKCPGGCYLPICSPECSLSPTHVLECRLVRDSIKLPEGSWRLDLLAVLIPLRFMLLPAEDREVIKFLQGNQRGTHRLEVDILKRFMGDKVIAEEEEWVRQCCMIMDTNAYEFVQVHGDGSQSHLRGLFPLATMLNNDCSPNSCHVVNNHGVMKVFAARAIAVGEEVTTAYSALLWSTSMRRINLFQTKNFLCHCPRCRDPTELGSLLSCLACVEAGCHGLLLPVSPLQPHCRWLCQSCGLMVSPKQAATLQSALGLVLQRLCSSDPLTAAEFLSESETTHSIPSQSQVIQQIKNMLLWQLGHKSGFTYPELSLKMLNLKEQCCRDILKLLDILRVGYCRMKGLILLELHGSLYEKMRRNEITTAERQIITRESAAVLHEATTILQDDAVAQKELERFSK